MATRKKYFHGEVRKISIRFDEKSALSGAILQGPVVQSIVSLTSLLVINMLTVLVSTIPNLQVFLLKKKCKSYSHFFSKNISIYAIFNDQSLNNTLTNNIVSFEQLGPGQY